MGMKTGEPLDDQRFQTLVTTHVQAVTALLVGNSGLRPGVAIIATEPLDRHGQMAVAQMAAASATDVIVLEFSPFVDGKVEIVGINVVLERDGMTYFQARCHLWKSATSNRGLILPEPGSRGHFRLSSSEILHMDGKPAVDTAEGIGRATAWLERRRCGRKPAPSGVDFFHLSEAV